MSAILAAHQLASQDQQPRAGTDKPLKRAAAPPPMTPNPSLEPTRYGRHCKPGLSQSYYRLRPGLQYLPTRAA